MMRFALTLFIAGSPFGITDATNAVEDEPLVVPHLFSIDAPGEGFKWEEAKSGEVKGIKFRVYAGTKEGSTSRVSLTVQQHSAEREATKIAVIKGHYNGMIESLRDAGLTDLRGERPSLESPIPEKVAYSISATGPDGQPAFIEAATVFKKHVYFIQAYADSAQEAERLVKAVETLKEDP